MKAIVTEREVSVKQQTLSLIQCANVVSSVGSFCKLRFFCERVSSFCFFFSFEHWRLFLNKFNQWREQQSEKLAGYRWQCFTGGSELNFGHKVSTTAVRDNIAPWRLESCPRELGLTHHFSGSQRAKRLRCLSSPAPEKLLGEPFVSRQQLSPAVTAARTGRVGTDGMVVDIQAEPTGYARDVKTVSTTRSQPFGSGTWMLMETASLVSRDYRVRHSPCWTS